MSVKILKSLAKGGILSSEKRDTMNCSFQKMMQVISIVMTLLGGTVIAQAVQIMPTSYDMQNGYGVSSGGEYNYWDAGYTGAGNKTADGAILTGGLGKLTDGVIATTDWEWHNNDGTPGTVCNMAGTGPYVGWTDGNPEITFKFNQATINDITFYVDNPVNHYGGVAAPNSFTINGKTYAVDESSLGYGPVAINLSNLNLTNIDDLTVEINRDLSPGCFWVFLSEVTFDDGNPAPVPEPASLTLIGTGIAVVALLRIRRKKYTCGY
jgi:hypothetical protein